VAAFPGGEDRASFNAKKERSRFRSDPKSFLAGLGLYTARLVRVDTGTAKVLGSVASPIHSVSISADGSVYTGTVSGGVVLFIPRK
jgi:hypothetical protein